MTGADWAWLGALAASGAIIAAIVTVRAWLDGRRKLRAIRHIAADGGTDLALVITCKPCHGEDGHCTCPYLCGADGCAGEYEAPAGQLLKGDRP